MSVEALSLVLNHSQASGTDKLVLVGIANHDGDGGAWPSLGTLARYANVDIRTVRRSIRKLEDMGELVVDIQGGGTAAMEDHKRPNRYTITVTPRTPTSPPDAHVLPPRTPTSSPPRTPTSPKPSLEPSLNQGGEPSRGTSPARAHAHDPDIHLDHDGLPIVTPPRCPTHLHDLNPPPCPACRDARTHHDKTRAARDTALDTRHHHQLLAERIQAQRQAVPPPPGFLRAAIRPTRHNPHTIEAERHTPPPGATP
jgi:hypothetical protein